MKYLKGLYRLGLHKRESLIIFPYFYLSLILYFISVHFGANIIFHPDQTCGPQIH